eukprot:TRINITY_DN11958_c0_g1_i1.p1 TRINITY_DN11958_c0_g1~~TRINITY_DN11958_c0_g1_i1.p1  ORF type:complete len:525 (+),score=70.72 TRINITY_DN11958_c0_g1_i1:46-1620(+)
MIKLSFYRHISNFPKRGKILGKSILRTVHNTRIIDPNPIGSYRKAIKEITFCVQGQQKKFKEPEKIVAQGNGYKLLILDNEKEVVLKGPDLSKVPQLAHGLESVLFSKGNVFSPSLDLSAGSGGILPGAYIHPPSTVNYDIMAPFIPSSQDTTLLKLCREHQCKYVGSTSSLTEILSQFYFLFSNHKLLNLGMISSIFHRSLSKSFTRTALAPKSICLHYKDGVYAVDARKPPDSEVLDNQILLDMGRIIEKLLTLPTDKFESQYLLANNPATGPRDVEECYHYMKKGNFVMRAQIDCHHPELDPPTFDIKSRAIVSIRLNMKEYQQFTSKGLQSLSGRDSSFEREFYDMARAAFIKYCFQARIGHMHGIFIALHNTEVMYGFEYITLSELERIIFHTNIMAQVSFDVTVKLWSVVLDEITQTFPEESFTIHLNTIRPSAVANSSMQIFIERASGEIVFYNLKLMRVLNGQVVSGPWAMKSGDNLEVYYLLKREFNEHIIKSRLEEMTRRIVQKTSKSDQEEVL